MEPDDVTRAYERRATEYVDALGGMDSVDPRDRRLVLGWAAGHGGPLLDAGCGPGHWTGLLRSAGHEVEGIDLVGSFLDSARARFPQARFRRASLLDPGVPDDALAGVLAWYSLIHLEPGDVDRALSAFARATRPGGGLLLGFFAGPDLEPFDHAVTPAWFWPPALLAERVESAGYRVTSTDTRSSTAHRTHGQLTAIRTTP